MNNATAFEQYLRQLKISKQEQEKVNAIQENIKLRQAWWQMQQRAQCSVVPVMN